MQVTIAGSGGWGTALAILLHENGQDGLHQPLIKPFSFLS